MIVEDGYKIQSTYKHLVVSGCSFTSNLPAPDDEPFQWPNLIAEWSGIKLHNLAIPGAGNTHISNSIRLYLDINNLPPEETLVIVMWSGIDRIDFMTDPDASKFTSVYPFGYDYSDSAELSLGGNWWNISNPCDIQKAIINYSKFQNNETYAIQSYLNMQSLSDYLSIRGYKYYFTSYFNYNILDKIEGNNDSGIDFFGILKKLNLSSDRFTWVALDPCQYFGNWSKKYSTLQQDNFHPGREAVERWPKEVLLPYLINERVFTYDS